ncbi:MAG: shikimate dehydrogenase [Pseudomonadota bacterium]|uniref:shikimate dehydrogenase n=1 Tax=Thalassococcus sp. TaxID=1928858 RepID=UPI001B14413B|nr:shikimate dehydrogenase [Thalassococcus sp.]MBO6866437.1 shikimate dehydrogenase [Thalassococcus sp.]MEC8579158.1 shikimate dehydrogenase [Pseudomonadota bacterium]MEE3358934.1 shikimate dehydrogenase [Pseudomonadota bacterium]
MTANRIPLAGVIGSPIAHSKSPQLHGYWLRKYGLPGYYIPMEIAADKLESALKTLPELGFVGVNVTIPYKEKVLEIADLITDRAAVIGAANTLIFRSDGKIHADNTDGYGFIANLRQKAPTWEPKAGPAVVLGAGGAARAIVASLIEAGCPEILITNRTRARADKLREDFGKRLSVIEWVQAGNVMEDAATVVNTTSLGMVGKPELRVPLDGLRPTTLVTDIVYTPLETKLLKTAREIGCPTVDGLGMLLHQAVPGFERWFNKRPEVDDALRAAVLR